MGRAKTGLADTQQVLHSNLRYLRYWQLPLAPVRPAHDVADGQAAPGRGHGWALRVILPIEVLGLHGGEGRCVLQGQVADSWQVVAAAVGP